MTTAREVTVRGEVQGVAFRAYCQAAARDRGVHGWVQNQPDGTVRAVFEGDQDAVEAMVAWCREGSPSASVSEVEVGETAPEGRRGFRVV